MDRHGRRATDLRLSVIDKCNLRCTYCMPAEGLPWLPAAGLTRINVSLDADHGWTREEMVTAAEIRDRLSLEYRLTPHPHARDGAPAQLWEVRPQHSTGPGDRDQVLGTVGIIASVTEPFCTECKRTRITAEGRIRSCLFSHQEHDLLGLLRAGATDTQLAERWRAAMWAKPAAHGMDHPGLDSPDYIQPQRSMSAIGG